MRSGFTFSIFVPLLLLWFLAGPMSAKVHFTVKEDSVLRFQSEMIMKAIKERNWFQVSSFMHGSTELVFSPYAFIDTTVAVRISKKAIGKSGKKFFFWGYMDGTGDSIRMSLNTYSGRFILNAYCGEETKILVNEFYVAGNSAMNISALFPDCAFVEYHCKGTAADQERNWSAVRFIFRKIGERYYLAGIVSDRWQDG